MARAKKKAARRTPAKKAAPSQGALYGVAMLCCGLVVGVLGTTLWQGMRSDDTGVGSGIRQILEDTDPAPSVRQKVIADNKPVATVEQKTNYDFFTVLPEIEIVVSLEPQIQPAKAKKKPNESSRDTSQSAYMLQAGSYRRTADAERMKAKLALRGLVSYIQKISIEGRGDFYRVRLGPFLDRPSMVYADKKLKEAGIKALQLKVAGG
jgi:cell division protein FtsN